MAKAQILLVASYHFDNPNLDVFNMATDDVLSPKRQAEIQTVVEKLAHFQPTKIAVEQNITKQERLNELYSEYCQKMNSGIPSEKRNEIIQLGFRLAQLLGHQQVYAIDVQQDLDFETVMKYAAENGQAAMIEALQASGQNAVSEFAERQENSSVGELLYWFNEEASLAENHRIYVDLLRIGKAPDYVGVKLVQDWYSRNLKIFNELCQIAEENSRILVFYGQGHIPIIRQTILDSSHLELANPLDYL